MFSNLISDKKFLSALLFLCLCNIILYKAIIFKDNNHVNRCNGEFPSQIESWTARDVVYDKNVIASLDPDKTIYKTYYKNGNPEITLFIAFYNSLEKADLSHSPIVCFTGQGWDITETSTKKINIGSSDNETIKINKMIQHKSDTKMITYFWYQSKNRAFSNRGLQKIYLFFKKLFKDQESNAFVRLTITVPNSLSQEKTTVVISDFVKVLYPELRRYFS